MNFENVSIETGAICSNCKNKPDVLLYCYPDTSWEEAINNPGTAKKVILCHDCAMAFIRLKLMPVIRELIDVEYDAAAFDTNILHIGRVFEDDVLHVNYLLEFDVKIDPSDDNAIRLIAGQCIVGRKINGIARFRGLRTIPARLEEFPDKAFDSLFDSLLELVFDMIPRVDYTPTYDGTEDGLDEKYIYEPLLGQHHPAIPEFSIPET